MAFAAASALPAGSANAQAPSAPAPEPPPTVWRDGAEVVMTSENSVPGRTYFAQHSTDMVEWRYITWMDVGGNNPIDARLTISGNTRNFLRFKTSDAVPPGGAAPAYDFDHDGLGGLAEVMTHHTDPFDPDSDNDGMPDGWEVQYALNPNSAADAAAHGDGDTLTNLREYQLGTNPKKSDTDGDGLTDQTEATGGTDPARFDMPAFTVLSQWRRAELTEKASRQPTGSTHTASVKNLGTGVPAERTYTPTSLPAFPWSLGAAASAAWSQAPGIGAVTATPEAVHDMSLPLTGYSGGGMIGDPGGGFLPGGANPNSQQYRTVSRRAQVMECSVRIRATRAMPVAWTIPFTRSTATLTASSGEWGSATHTASVFTFAQGAEYSNAAVLKPVMSVSVPTRDWDATPAPGRWVENSVNQEAKVEWITFTNRPVVPPNPSSPDRDGDGLSNILEEKIGLNPNVANSDGEGHADGDALNAAMLPAAAHLHISTRVVSYVFDQWTQGGDEYSFKFRAATDTPLENAFAESTDTPTDRLDVDAKLQARAAGDTPFPSLAPVTPGLPSVGGWLPGAVPFMHGFAHGRRPHAHMFYWPDVGGAPLEEMALGVQRRVRMVHNPKRPEAVTYPYLKVRTVTGRAAAPGISVSRVDFTVPADERASNFEDLLAQRLLGSETSATDDGVQEELAALEQAPGVLAVNSDFDEGRIHETTGYAIPDCEDTGRTLLPERDHLDGRWKTGTPVTEDLHEGWFGVRPDRLDAAFWNGATVTIKKLDKTDPDTDQPESGEVRFYATDGSVVRCIQPYDHTSHAAVNLVTGGIHGVTGQGVYGATSTLRSFFKFWIEGVKPGKITLEWRYVKGSVDVRHEQTFLVATQQTANEWRKEVRYQIRLQTMVKPRLHGLEESIDGGLDVTRLSPSLGFDGGMNDKCLRQFYYYYRQLFREKPEKFMWAGMAKVAGAEIYAGMAEMELWNDIQSSALWPGAHDPGSIYFLRDFLITGAHAIFDDMAWTHHAYAASGWWALKHVSETEVNQLRLDAWTDLRNGLDLQNDNLIRESARKLLEREQLTVMQPYYAVLSTKKIKPPVGGAWVGAVAVPLDANGLADMGEWISANSNKNPIPTGPPLRGLIPGGRLDNYADRWRWIDDPAFGMLHIWTGMNAIGPGMTVAGRAYHNGLRLRDAAMPYLYSPIHNLPSEP